MHPLKIVALGITQLCVRNTIIEKYHAEGKLTDKEMKAFNKEVANKIYTALDLLNSADPDDRRVAELLFRENLNQGWDTPEDCNGLRKAVRRRRRELEAEVRKTK